MRWWGISRIVVAAALVALLAPALAACGGDDEATTSSRDSAALPDPQDGAEKGDSQPPGDGGAKDQAGAGSGRGEAAEGAQADVDVDPAPLKVSGGGSGQFRVNGGDNSIQNWGEESEESQLEEAAEAVHDYYVARANEEWAEACTYLARSMVEQLEQFAKQSGKQGSPDCATLLKALTRHPLPASVRRESTVVDAGSLRIGEDNSFLIYRGTGGTVFAMPVVEEDGTWKLTLISATTLG